jgi:lipoteichoic acid synthase
MYGDHYGISQNHNRAMEQVLDKELSTFDSAAGLQRVPLFIRVPGMEGGINHEYGGQIDILPTLLHLLGIDSKEYIQFGTDLLSEDHDSLVPFRNGDFVSPTISSVGGKFYNSETGELIDEEQMEKAQQLQEVVEYKLHLSDKVVNGDLLRFYTPAEFTPIDRSMYEYNSSDKEAKTSIDE